MISVEDLTGAPTARAQVRAHGEIEENFTGEITPVDDDNYITFVRHPQTGVVLGCNNAFVTLLETR